MNEVVVDKKRGIIDLLVWTMLVVRLTSLLIHQAFPIITSIHIFFYHMIPIKYYILDDDNKPKLVTNKKEWLKWHGDNELECALVGYDVVMLSDKINVYVNTCFDGRIEKDNSMFVTCVTILGQSPDLYYCEMARA